MYQVAPIPQRSLTPVGGGYGFCFTAFSFRKSLREDAGRSGYGRSMNRVTFSSTPPERHDTQTSHERRRRVVLRMNKDIHHESESCKGSGVQPGV